jgi:photosystem II stability/assembly factor-like uncharacterized protein
MQNIPKIVRERLRSATPAVNHPDADLLTAFAERSLQEIDRGVVLEHLAHCIDCRDIVALALPETEPVQTVLRPSPGGWLTWPVLRWGFIAAGVVAMASIGVVQYRGRFRSEPVASQTSMASPDSKPGSKGVEVASNEPKKQALDQFVAAAPVERRDKLQVPAAPAFTAMSGNTSDADKKSRAGSEASLSAASTPAPVAGGASAIGGPVRGAASFGPRVANNQWQQNGQQNAVQNQASAVPPPSAYSKQGLDAANQPANLKGPASSEAVEVSGEEPMVSTQAQNVDVSMQPSADQATVARAKSLVTAANAGAAPAPSGAARAAAAPALLPLWTITSAGSLQRSFDQGKSWQTVDVNANLIASNFATSFDATSLNISDKASPAAVEGKKEKDSDKSRKRQRATPATFRAVAAAGSEVWAGGSAGALFHSLDGGNHWTPVVPASASTTLTGDILSIEFPDPQHGKLSTSTSETWSTSDDGTTWQKQ